MPFTLAHPVIMLPLDKTNRFSITALIAGSMVPDFEFFFQMREVENIGHHWYGILLFDLPVAIVFCFAFHNLLKQLLIINLPESYRNKFINVIGFNWNAYAAANKMKILLSLLVGIFSHIAWDAFTHYDGFFVLLLPVLQYNISIMGKTIPVYFLLQIFSSFAGMWLLYRAITKLPDTATGSLSVKTNVYYWPAFIIVFTIIVVARIYIWPQYNSFWGIVMACMGSFIYAWVLISFIFKNTQTKNLYA